MMQDVAMHLLEIVMNSISAKATDIDITIEENHTNNILLLQVVDNGCGMSDDIKKKVIDPFVTSRKTRKIGLGLSFFKGLCDVCNGSFHLESEVGVGTTIEATLQLDHWDLPPLGNIGELMMFAISNNDSINYRLTFLSKTEFIFTSKEIKDVLDGASMQDSAILLWIKEYINEHIQQAKEDKHEELR